ncbi:MAG TPA: hypothetical protein VGJ83_06275 [Gemmatimonadales bacterium]|jgi:uncharacterized protein YxjI
MSVRVSCQCGTTYELKDEFAGKLVKCPQCGRENRVPAGAGGLPVQVQADPAFDRDIFLLRQQMLRISEKYDVGDEKGNNIIYIERPAHLLRNLGAVLAAIVAFFVVFSAFAAVADQSPAQSAARAILMILGIVLAFVGALAVGIPLSAKRHVTFYRDGSKRDRLIEVLQDKKWQPITMTYTVRDFRGKPLARLAKNILYNLIRKRWYVFAPDGRLAYVAKEDSVILSLLRRVLGPLFGLLRTNFIIIRPDSEDVIGEFKRKFTILDRYVLDMTADPQRTMDRRVALALGVMLDTGERR